MSEVTSRWCERCGGEGKLYTSRYGGNDPDVWPTGTCAVCEGTGYALVETEPVEIEDILAMTDEECLAAGIAEYGSEEAWRAAMAALKAKMLATVDAHMAAQKPTPDPAVMANYIDKLTRFFIDNTEWVRLSEEARGYIGALEPHSASDAKNPAQSRGTPL
jgi:hypothetical protein